MSNHEYQVTRNPTIGYSIKQCDTKFMVYYTYWSLTLKGAKKKAEWLKERDIALDKELADSQIVLYTTENK